MGAHRAKEERKWKHASESGYHETDLTIDIPLVFQETSQIDCNSLLCSLFIADSVPHLYHPSMHLAGAD